MQSIKLTRGYEVVVNDEDFEWLNQWKWFAFATQGKVYAARSIRINSKQARTIYMHRVILDAPLGMHTDHVDGNGLNNCRDNLRVCTRKDNMRNQFSRPNTSSQYKGVVKHPQCNRWMAQLSAGGSKYLGLFKSEEEAAHAYDKAARIHHGEFARLNFPKDGEHHA